MRDYVHSVNKTYAKLLFADIRDSVCQTDPFSEMKGFPGADSALYVFQEAAPTKRAQDGTINSEGKNRNWVVKCFGPQGLAKVQHGVVSCAGITIGGWDAAVKVSCVCVCVCVCHVCMYICMVGITLGGRQSVFV